MKTYLLACTTAALSSAAMALWSQPDGRRATLEARVPAAHAAAARHAHSLRTEAMARRHAHPWLLRAMSQSGGAGTLTPAPNEPPAPPPSL